MWYCRGYEGLYKTETDHSCDIFAKNLALFCLCPEHMTEVGLDKELPFLGRGNFKMGTSKLVLRKQL